MPEEKRKLIEEITMGLETLDNQSLGQVEFMVSILIARERQVSLSKEMKLIL